MEVGLSFFPDQTARHYTFAGASIAEKNSSHKKVNEISA